MQTFAVILLVILLAFLLLGGCENNPIDGTVFGVDNYDNLDATATFGAKEFHIQLTAISATDDCGNTNGCEGVTK